MRPPLNAVVLGGALVSAAMTWAEAAELTRFPAPGGEQAVISIHSAADLPAMTPLIRDFQSTSPNVTVEYREYITNDLFVAAQQVCDSKDGSMDLILSSAVDHLVKLANDGCALPYRSPAAARLPSWMRWRDEVFGFTFEPAVIVYNRNLVPAADIRRTRTELIELLRAKAETYEGKIGSYDIVRSGIGYLFASFDARSTTTYGRLLEAFGRSKLIVRCCTADLLAELSEGRIAIGYNLLGSYAVAAARRGAPLSIVIPRDYAVVLSRAALIPRNARATAGALRFLEYLISARGQQKAREEAFFFGLDSPLPEEVDGPPSLSSSGLMRPIAIGPELLAVQDRAKRERFLAEWQRSTQVGIDRR